MEFVTDVEGNESEAWTYFRGPDGYLYELWQTARPLKAPPNQRLNHPVCDGLPSGYQSGETGKRYNPLRS